MGEQKKSEWFESFERLQYNYVSVFKAWENGKTQLVHDLNIIKKELIEDEKYKKVVEIFKKYPRNRNSLQNFRFMVGYWERNNIKVTKELLQN